MSLPGLRAYGSAGCKPAPVWADAVDLYQLRHELRTPLTGMLGLAELLSAQDLPGHAPFWLATLQACGQQMANLIDRSLRPQIQTGKNDPRAESGIDGGHFLEQLIGSHWPAARAGDTQLNLLVQSGARTSWRADPVLLRQALDNLLANAIRFSPNGSVTLEACVLPDAASDADTLLLFVENIRSGNCHEVGADGVPALQIADSKFTTRSEGTFDYADRCYRMFRRGQGLQVVEQVCHALRGQLQRSQTADGATRFVLQLPAVVLRGEKQFRPFRPDMLSKLHCLVLLDPPLERVVAALLRDLNLSFACVDRLEEAAFRALPEKHLLICSPSRLPVAWMGRGYTCHPHSIYLVARLNYPCRPEWHVQDLPAPLMQAELQTALLRCLVVQGMAAREAQVVVE